MEIGVGVERASSIILTFNVGATNNCRTVEAFAVWYARVVARFPYKVSSTYAYVPIPGDGTQTAYGEGITEGLPPPSVG